VFRLVTQEAPRCPESEPSAWRSLAFASGSLLSRSPTPLQRARRSMAPIPLFAGSFLCAHPDQRSCPFWNGTWWSAVNASPLFLPRTGVRRSPVLTRGPSSAVPDLGPSSVVRLAPDLRGPRAGAHLQRELCPRAAPPTPSQIRETCVWTHRGAPHRRQS